LSEFTTKLIIYNLAYSPQLLLLIQTSQLVVDSICTEVLLGET